jgi:hypothetical protein
MVPNQTNPPFNFQQNGMNILDKLPKVHMPWNQKQVEQSQTWYPWLHLRFLSFTRQTYSNFRVKATHRFCSIAMRRCSKNDISKWRLSKATLSCVFKFPTFTKGPLRKSQGNWFWNPSDPKFWSTTSSSGLSILAKGEPMKHSNASYN